MKIAGEKIHPYLIDVTFRQKRTLHQTGKNSRQT